MTEKLSLVSTISIDLIAQLHCSVADRPWFAFLSRNGSWIGAKASPPQD